MERTAVQSQIVKTARGWVAIAYTNRGIRALTLPEATPEKALRALTRRVGSSSARGRQYGELARDLDRYFGGEPAPFDYPLDLEAGTPFQRRVWARLRAIPYGETRTYGAVAVAIGMPGSARAVGQAIGANPIPILIPCHRVVAAGGLLGGYAWGLTWKRHLLSVEGIGPPRRTESRTTTSLLPISATSA